MNLEQMIERLLYLRDNGYAVESERVVIRDEDGMEFDINDIETDGGQVVILA